MKFKTPFITEHLIRGKTQAEKNENSLFENIKDKSKFNFKIKNGIMSADQTDKSNRSSMKNLSEAEIHRLSKGEFKYLLRIYNYDMYSQQINRLERAIMLFQDKKFNENISKEFKEKGICEKIYLSLY